eukprot:gene46135-61687_t
MNTQNSAAWHPVARSADLRPGDNIVAGFAEGQELALWRAADGTAQAWENRCPHRSVRFTLGQVVDNHLACAYHGWQYEAGSGQCTRIPAHPAMPAPRNVCARTFAAAEAAGMLWVHLSPQAPAALAMVEPQHMACNRVPGATVLYKSALHVGHHGLFHRLAACGVFGGFAGVDAACNRLDLPRLAVAPRVGARAELLHHQHAVAYGVIGQDRHGI